MNRFLTLFYGFIRFLQEILLDFNAPDTSNLPKTGDGSSPALWLAVCLGCAAAVALLLRKRSAR